MMQPPGGIDICDQPKDLSMKSPRLENKDAEVPQNVDKNMDPDGRKLNSEEKLRGSPRESFQEIFLNLKQKDRSTKSVLLSSRASPLGGEDPLEEENSSDVFMNEDENDQKSVEKGEGDADNPGNKFFQY